MKLADVPGIHAVLINIVICTHNRASLLMRTLESLNSASRPSECDIELLVIANACTDRTVEELDDYRQRMNREQLLPMRWAEETTTGKSYALNHAIGLLTGELVAFVDDDHRVDSNYLASICRTANQYPDMTLFCGRIFPDWDGREPEWAHDKGPYAIYPLPVPRYDQGDSPREIDLEGPLAGGGNLFLRREVFERIGKFSTAYGPQGHDLGGGEDGEFLIRALKAGERLQYVPDVIQYHYVEPERFKLRYLLRKSYQRTRAGMRIRIDKNRLPPRYLWRKLLTNIWKVVVSFYWPKARFYLVRVAATLGEINAYLVRQ